ncbi:MAG: hypothetical protein ACR2OE_11150 [Thermomicrobiales bacterium]
MFVRWKRTPRKDKHHWERPVPNEQMVRVIDPEWLRSAVLVECIRIDGKPRQRTVKYLGSIRERRLDLDDPYSISHRGYFWTSVDANLDSLGLVDSERARIVGAIEAVVPRPSTEAAPQAHHDLEERIARISRLAAQ